MTATIARPRTDWLSRLRSIMVLRPGQRVAHVPGIGVQASRRAVSSGGNGLLNALIAYWPGDEASGNLLDAHTNALHLTDTNTVTNAAGNVYASARQYTAANIEYHTRASEALLNASNDFTFAAWCYLDSTPLYATIIAKWTAAAGGRSYDMEYRGIGTNRFSFSVRNAADTGSGSVTANSFGAASTATWYLVIASHDDANNVLSISVNNGSPNTTAYSAGVLSGNGLYQVGAQNGGNCFDGRIGPVAMWKSAAGGGGVLTADQRTALYNGGAGLAYANFTT